MGLYFVFSIDGDWAEYFSSKLSMDERYPDKATLLKLVKHEIHVAASINGKFLHFVHISPASRDFFLQPEFTLLWKKIRSGGGNVGVHCHHESFFGQDLAIHQGKKREAITALTQKLSEQGLDPVSYRGGYMSFSEKDIPLLEQNGLFLDFSCDPERHLVLEGKLVSDWQGASGNYYRMNYEDHRKSGSSQVFEIPLGKTAEGSLYIDNTSLWGVWKGARALARKAKNNDGDMIVSALSHTYEFSSFWKRLKIRLALLICKKYGSFINDREALKIAQGRKE